MEEGILISELDEKAQLKARAIASEGKRPYAHKRRFWTVKAKEDLPEKTAHLYKLVML